MASIKSQKSISHVLSFSSQKPMTLGQKKESQIITKIQTKTILLPSETEHINELLIIKIK
jgi:hypothetical protein